MLCMEHVDISYNSRVPKMVKGIVNNRMGGAARIEDGVIGVLDTWLIEVGGRIGSCMKRGAVDSFVFAFCPLVDDPVVD